MPELTILTPAYNRLSHIKKLLTSLVSQINSDFQWLVIDDGSTDGTRQWFENLDRSQYSFLINYHYKENGGKHIALNYAHKYIVGNYVVIVDSDDLLVSDATQTIINYWHKYINRQNIGGITFQKGDFEKHTKFDKTIIGVKESTFAEMTNRGMAGDHCETFRADLFKQQKFPTFENENFVAEGAMWYLLTRNYNVVYVDKVIYLAEYLEGGLTKSGRRLRITNPAGSRWHAGVFLDSQFNLKIRLKNALLFDTYSRFIDDQFRTVKDARSNQILLALAWWPSFVLYQVWKRKYE